MAAAVAVGGAVAGPPGVGRHLRCRRTTPGPGGGGRGRHGPSQSMLPMNGR